MELMEGLTIVATESNGDLDIIAGIIVIGVMIIVFGGIFCYLSNDSTGIAFILGVIWTFVGVFILILGIMGLIFNDAGDVYTVIVNDSVNFNELVEKYKIIEYNDNLLKIQLRD